MHNPLISSFWEAGWFGRMIIIGLFFLSVYTWALITMKYRLIKGVESATKSFINFLKTQQQIDLLEISRKLTSLPDSPYKTMFSILINETQSLLRSNSRLNKSHFLTKLQFHTIEETAQRISSDIVIELEKNLVHLATIASISPLLGLLGTVWGVFTSFRGIATLGSATLNVVAPGISEALITTVVGLIVAIPALWGYNWLTNRINIYTKKMESFVSYILSCIQSSYLPQTTYEKELSY